MPPPPASALLLQALFLFVATLSKQRWGTSGERRSREIAIIDPVRNDRVNTFAHGRLKGRVG